MRLTRALMPVFTIFASIVAPLHTVGGHAAGTHSFASAPYDDASADSSCPFDGFTGTCDIKATADSESGAFDLNASIQSPDEGAIPSAGSAAADATFNGSLSLAQQTQALMVAPHFTIDEIAATVDGLAPPVVGDSISPAFVEAAVTVAIAGCDACSRTVTRRIADASTLANAPQAAAGEYAIPVTIFRADARPIDPGIVSIGIFLEARSTLVGTGTRTSQIAATLDSIELALPSSTQTLTAPFASAYANRGCSGSYGTTFACHAAAASSTGRIDMTLGVTTPVAGTVPGDGSAEGEAVLGATTTASSPARAVVYLLTFAVTSADTYAQASPLGSGSRDPLSSAAANLEGSIGTQPDPGCNECTNVASLEVASIDGPRATRLDDEIPFVVGRQSYDGTPLPDERSVDFAISGFAVLTHRAGTALTTLQANVARIDVIDIE